MLRGPAWEHTRLIHRSLLRLIPRSVDECDGRMTIALSLGEAGQSRRGSDEHRSRPVRDVVPGQQGRRLHGQPHAPDLPSPGAIAPVLLGEEHPPTQHGAGHSAQLVDPPQRLSRRRRPRHPQDLTVRSRYFVDVCCWPPHATQDASDGRCRPGWRSSWVRKHKSRAQCAPGSRCNPRRPCR